MPTTTTRRFKVLGRTEDAPSNGCECCGKMNLKVYVVLEPLEGGPLVYMGTTCGAKAEGMTVKEITTEIKAVEEASRKAAAAKRAEADRVETVAFLGWVEETYGVKATQASDLWGAVPGMTPLQIRQAWRAAPVTLSRRII